MLQCTMLKLNNKTKGTNGRGPVIFPPGAIRLSPPRIVDINVLRHCDKFHCFVDNCIVCNFVDFCKIFPLLILNWTCIIISIFSV